jgi:hypothetical protein
MPLVLKMATTTTEELVCSAVSEERVCNSCATCISHTISHGTTQPSIHLRLVQGSESQLPQLPSLGTLCTKFRTSWIIVSTSAVWLAEHISSLCEVCTKLWVFFYRLVLVWSSKYAAFVFCSFCTCKVLLCSPLYSVAPVWGARKWTA